MRSPTKKYKKRLKPLDYNKVEMENMNKIAFRENSGNWIYYLTWLTYKEVSLYVKKVDKELHQSNSLNNMIQRSLTDNVKRIAAYIERQPEHFFNALVLAVYDGDPQWREIELEYDNEEKYNLGILELSGEEKIFPVDGQHRVEGIKEVLQRNNNGEFDNETIPVIFIGHKNTTQGMQRTRRLFSTLNRYAKPVTLNDIIALDEDDIIAIATRHLIETNELFHEERLNNHKQKAIPDNDKVAFTNIISLYECNTELLKYFLKDKQVLFDGRELKGKRKIDEYCRVRPVEEDINTFLCFVDQYWSSFSENLDVIKKYLATKIDEQPALIYRNKNGGNLLFRPIGQRPFVLCALGLYDRIKNMRMTMQTMNKINFEIDSELWKFIVWNPINKKMITSSNGTLIEYLLKYFAGVELTSKEFLKMKEDFRSMKGDEHLTDDEICEMLNRCRIS